MSGRADATRNVGTLSHIPQLDGVRGLAVLGVLAYRTDDLLAGLHRDQPESGVR